MERECLDKCIGTVTCQEMLENLERDVIDKKVLQEVKPNRLCRGRYWMSVAFPTITWMFLDHMKYADEHGRHKFEGKNSYYHIATWKM